MPATSGSSNMPPAEVSITSDLVTGLLQEQHPDLASLPLTLVGHGWDNVMYRLGSELTVRLPRRTMAAALIENEQRWLPELAPHLPLPVPAPVRIGRPSTTVPNGGGGTGFPWHWSVVPWFDGRPAAEDRLKPMEAAADLGRFLAALHLSAPDNAPVNPGRGGPLTDRDEMTVARIEAITGGRERSTLLARWQRHVSQPAYQGPPMWLHGDLHAHNVLSADGRITAVIDFGDITSGDPATDLALAFSLFDARAMVRFRQEADSPTRPIDDAMWVRAEGWAISVGLAVLANSADRPDMAAMGRRMIWGFSGDG